MHGQVELIEYEDARMMNIHTRLNQLEVLTKNGNLKEKMYYSGTAKWYTFNT